MHGFKAKRIPVLDGLRGFAILLVVAHHQLIPVPLSGGFLGVDLFFVLSGFLITTLLVEEFDAAGSISLRRFYTRRVLRLAPALLLYLLVSLIVVLRTDPAQFKTSLQLVGLSLVYMTNWRMAFSPSPTLDPTAIIWSLSIEEQFYVLWPPVLFALLFFRVKRRYLITGLAVVILGVMVHRYLLWNEGVNLHRLYYGTDSRADAPLIGCLIALIPFRLFEGASRRVVQTISFVAILAFAIMVYELDFSSPFLYRGGYTLVAILAALMTWTVTVAPAQPFAAVFGWSPLRWLGKISYGFYLWHWLMLKTTTFYAWFGAADPWVRFLVTIGVSAASFYVIEMPFNRMKSRFDYANKPSRRLARSSETERPGLRIPGLSPTPVVTPSE